MPSTLESQDAQGESSADVHTARLSLRPVRDTDLAILASAINNPRISRNLTRVPWPYDLNDAVAFYEATRTLPARSAIFAIAPRTKPDRLIGVIGYEGAPDPEFGYWLDEAFWGQGIMREAAQAVVAQAFTVGGIERIQSRCIVGNEPSRRILIGLGFRPVGISSVYSSARKGVVVSQTFELTAREWRLARCTHADSSRRRNA